MTSRICLAHEELVSTGYLKGKETIITPVSIECYEQLFWAVWDVRHAGFPVPSPAQELWGKGHVRRQEEHPLFFWSFTSTSETVMVRHPGLQMKVAQKEGKDTGPG